MKIVLISARRSSPMACEHYIYTALRKLGHEVIADLDFRLNWEMVNKDIPREADLLLAWKGSTLNPAVIKDLSYPTVLWYPDFWAMPHAKQDMLKLGKAFDYVYTPCFNDVAVYRDLGLNAHYLMPGVDIRMFRPLPEKNKEHDVVMCGALYEERVVLLDKLYGARLDVVVQNGLLHAGMNKLYNRSKLVFNQGIIPGEGAQLRVFEAMASGTTLLNCKCPELEAVFEDKKHCIYFGDNDLAEIAKYYIDHDEEREKIAQVGREEMVANHTWEKRLEIILEAVSMSNV